MLLSDIYKLKRAQWNAAVEEMKRLEEENNRIFIDAYGLQDELTPDVPLKEITLTCNPVYRYGEGDEADLEQRLLADTIKELLSYAVGCAMGRYSLDEPGLIYAHAGNVGFDKNRYKTFPADDDGIIPLMERDWFPDDMTRRFEEFLTASFGKENLAVNLKFVEDSLGKEIRDHYAKDFFADHLKRYKKRPIYWLFSSGKLKAFQCIVYLHRYNAGTLSRMRTEYLVSLQAKINARLDRIPGERNAAGSTAAKKQLDKEADTLKNQAEELRVYDEKLRHYADMKIELDLDDGVKVNYGKFGDLLANVKDIAGKRSDEE